MRRTGQVILPRFAHGANHFAWSVNVRRTEVAARLTERQEAFGLRSCSPRIAAVGPYGMLEARQQAAYSGERMAMVTETQVSRVKALLRQGATNKEIVSRVGVSLGTLLSIKAHRTRGQMKEGPSVKAYAANASNAIRTAIWAHTKVKSLITSSRQRGRGWEVVNFLGSAGCESVGIVDLMAVRKDHRRDPSRPPGDWFEIILIQVKGGTARRPDEGDIARLRLVAKRYHAREVVLAEWTVGTRPTFCTLTPRRGALLKDAWEIVDDPVSLFR